jgi:flagella basal body P-ring formation protein FlgA
MTPLKRLLAGMLLFSRGLLAAGEPDGVPPSPAPQAVATVSATAKPAPAKSGKDDAALVDPTAAAESWLAVLTPLLLEHYQPAGELVLSFARPRPVAAPADATLALASCPTELATQMLVNVRASDSNGRVTDCLLVLHAELWRNGWTLREPAANGDPVRAGGLDVRRYDALRDHDALAVDPSQDLDFARNVPADRLLTWHDVVRRPLVHRGLPVEVLAMDGALTVSLRALALQDAARGEPVRVRNLDTNKEFTAVVTAESKAVVSF